MTFFTDAKAFFHQARRALGDPVATVVLEYSAWEDNLPVGYGYNDSTDAIEDKNGVVLTDPEQYWSTAVVEILPETRKRDALVMSAAGLSAAGSESFYVYGQSAISAVSNSFRVLFSHGEFKVSAVERVSGIANEYALVTVTRWQ